MNTVDALNVLGKALCGDSFETKPGLTDAETILEIAKNYTGGSDSGGCDCGGVEIKIKADISGSGSPTIDPLSPGLSVSDFSNARIAQYVMTDGAETPQAVLKPSVAIDVNPENIFIETVTEGQNGITMLVLIYNKATGEVSVRD